MESKKALDKFLTVLYTLGETIAWAVIGLVCVVFALLCLACVLGFIIGLCYILWTITEGWIIVWILVGLIAFLFWRLA